MKKLKILFLIMLVVLSFSSCKTVETTDDENENSTNNHNGISIEQVTPNYQIIAENKISLSSFNFEFPDDLSLLSDTVNPIAENSDGTFQLMIEDKTESVDDYIEHIKSTHSRYKAMGMDISDIGSISLNGFYAKRFVLNTKDEENEDVTMIFYFIEQDDLKIDAAIMLKGKKVTDYSGFDNYIATVKFFEN